MAVVDCMCNCFSFMHPEHEETMSQKLSEISELGNIITAKGKYDRANHSISIPHHAFGVEALLILFQIPWFIQNTDANAK